MQQPMHAVEFSVNTPELVLTKNFFVHNADRQKPFLKSTQNNHSRLHQTGNEKEVILQVHPPNEKTDSNARDRFKKPIIQFYTKYLISAVLLLSLTAQYRKVALQIILGTPCIWLLPVVLEVIDNTTQNTLVNPIAGMLHIIFFPIWMTNALHHEYYVWQNVFSVLSVCTALVFYFKIQSLTWMTLITVLVLLAFALPLTVTHTQIVFFGPCVLCMVIILCFSTASGKNNTK
jgi:hypothetical protein